MRVASVLLPRPLPQPLHYAVPDNMALAPGQFVKVPLASGSCIGLVLDLLHPESVQTQTLKPIECVLVEAPTIPATTRDFLLRAARYICARPGRLLTMMMRHHGGLEPPPDTFILVRSDEPLPPVLTQARQAVLDALKAQKPKSSAAELARAAGVSPSVVTGLLRANILERRVKIVDSLQVRPDPAHPSQTILTSDQQQAAISLREAVREQGFAPVLLDGVTGSGKTEVYFEAVADVLSSDPQAQILILLPEIALTRALIDRIAHRFGAEPVQWHSGVSPAHKRRFWREAALGQARIVVGARSALFLPFAHLRLIIVDEEHDTSYKQEDGLLYQARDLAVMRAHSAGAAVILASATPSLESLTNARNGRYRSVRLAARPGVARLPDVSLIDMRVHRPPSGQDLSPLLVSAIEQTLTDRGQVLLFLNRRGYAPIVLCQACGDRLRAPDTDNWLCEHRYSGRLVCHVTGFSMPRPQACPYCGAKDSLIGCGQGVERVSEQVRNLFPEAEMAMFSSDTVRDADMARAVIARMEAGDIQILVGTQMVAKGHNFPNLTLVGVVDADSGLQGVDWRASERTYQLLLQVAGRAGRADRPGRAILQTHMPENPALKALAAGDREQFITLELQARQNLGMPPFGRLGAVIVSAPSADKADAVCRLFSKAIPKASGVEVWGPALAQISILRGQHRRRFLVRADRGIDVSAFLSAWYERVKIPSGARVRLDVDPYSFS